MVENVEHCLIELSKMVLKRDRDKNDPKRKYVVLYKMVQWLFKNGTVNEFFSRSIFPIWTFLSLLRAEKNGANLCELVRRD